MAYRLLFIGLSSASAPTLWLGPKIREFECVQLQWAPGLYSRIREHNPKLLILIATSAADQAGDLIRTLHKAPLFIPTLGIIANNASDEFIGLAAQALDDFMFAPVRTSELWHRIARIIGDGDNSSPSNVEEGLWEELALAGLVGRDAAFEEAVSRIPLVARNIGPVLITGETGTGKELCARAIHSLSPRRNHAFVPVDCATVPEQLFESELFGHVRGAFTDAHSAHRGLVNLAEGGSLFLDEIDALSLSAQTKLLRLLQEHSYRPLGCDRPITLNAKIIAATNSDLRHLVKEGRFRADLFFRLNVLRVDLIPLRLRRNDIALLAQHFVKEVCIENRLSTKVLSPGAIRKLNRYDWPGNVRELRNAIERAVALSQRPEILPSHITEIAIEDTRISDSTSTGFREARSRAIESFEKEYVEEKMRESKGNVSLAARLAKKERRAFGRLVKRYRIKSQNL